MQSVTEEYAVTLNTKCNGSFYVGLSNEGDGINVFRISRSPIRKYDLLFDAINVKNLLEITLLKEEYFDSYGNYFYISDFNSSEVEEIKIMKCIHTTNTEITYI